MTAPAPVPARRFGIIHLSETAVRRLRLIAWATSGTAVAVLSVMAVLGMIPENPEGEWIRPAETQIQIILLVVVAVGLVLSVPWPAAGAAIVGLAGSALAVFAGVAHPPIVVVLAAVVFLVPALLLWLAWQHDATLGRISVLAVVTFGLLGGAWIAGDRVYQRFFGPAAPQSSTRALDGTRVRWAWSGAVTDHSFAVVVKPLAVVGVVGLLVAAEGRPEALVAEAPVADGVARLDADGLDPGVEYTYRFRLDGQLDPAWVGQVATSPAAGAATASVSIAFSSCARTGSNAAVFDEIRRLAPDLFVISGDLHYQNIGTDDLSAFQREYDRFLTASAPAALLRDVPVAYIWDDHDFGANDADHTSPSKLAAHSAYRSYVPHGPLPLESTMGQVIDLGPVRVLVTDLRSERDPDEQTLLGFAQRAWLERELLAARDIPLVIWVSPSPWIAEAAADADHWGGFAAERRDLANFVRESRIDNLVIVSGDAHMVAIDDGSHADYSTATITNPSPTIPVLAAAALDRPGSAKGGPYSEGMFPGAGQFGLVTAIVEDGRLTVRLEGRTGTGEVRVALEFTRAIP